jgi:hypothetical protein
VKCQGGDSNSRPTPKAFGAALLLQMINCESGIFLRFQLSFDLPCGFEGPHFLFRHNLNHRSQPLRCCCVTSDMLSEACLEIDAGTNIVATTRAT